MVLKTQPFAEDLSKAPRFRSSGSATDKWKAEERLCDAIAAELLMPERMFNGRGSEVWPVSCTVAPIGQFIWNITNCNGHKILGITPRTLPADQMAAVGGKTGSHKTNLADAQQINWPLRFAR